MKVLLETMVTTQSGHNSFSWWTNIIALNVLSFMITPSFDVNVTITQIVNMMGAVFTWGGGKAKFNVATPTYATVTCICITAYVYKQNPFNIISRGVQR